MLEARRSARDVVRQVFTPYYVVDRSEMHDSVVVGKGGRPGHRAEAVDGRVLLMLSTNGDEEPRFQIGTHLGTQQIFGANVDALAPGEAAVINGSALGYPREPWPRFHPESITFRPSSTFTRRSIVRTDTSSNFPWMTAKGSCGRSSPGNLYSTPKKVFIDPASARAVQIELDDVVPPIDSPEDTRYIKHVRIQSKLLTEFWGRPMHLGAMVLLPDGFEDHPDARYPVLYWQDHFQSSFDAGSGGFREEPPETELKGREQIERRIRS